MTLLSKVHMLSSVVQLALRDEVTSAAGPAGAARHAAAGLHGRHPGQGGVGGGQRQIGHSSMRVSVFRLGRSSTENSTERRRKASE